MNKTIVSILLTILATTAPEYTHAKESTCYGTTSNGRLEGGVQLPKSGPNYVGYSDIAHLVGRTYVHSEVKQIVIDAYKQLEKEQPDTVYKYAETGWEKGGEFKPHKTHRNGLSVDFMTPVINGKGESVHLPTDPTNRFGYDIEFDKNNQFEGVKIDYEALGAHIAALDKAAEARGHKLWRVIFDPELQSGLFETQYAEYIKDNITLSANRSWVRHDEHYHVDFEILCEK